MHPGVSASGLWGRHASCPHALTRPRPHPGPRPHQTTPHQTTPSDHALTWTRPHSDHALTRPRPLTTPSPRPRPPLTTPSPDHAPHSKAPPPQGSPTPSRRNRVRSRSPSRLLFLVSPPLLRQMRSTSKRSVPPAHRRPPRGVLHPRAGGASAASLPNCEHVTVYSKILQRSETN